MQEFSNTYMQKNQFTLAWIASYSSVSIVSQWGLSVLQLLNPYFCTFFETYVWAMYKNVPFKHFLSIFMTTGVYCYILLSPVIDDNVAMSIASTWLCTYMVLK